MIQYQILQTKIISNVRETVRRIAKRIMGVKGLNYRPQTHLARGIYYLAFLA